VSRATELLWNPGVRVVTDAIDVAMCLSSTPQPVLCAALGGLRIALARQGMGIAAHARSRGSLRDISVADVLTVQRSASAPATDNHCLLTASAVQSDPSLETVRPHVSVNMPQQLEFQPAHSIGHA